MATVLISSDLPPSLRSTIGVMIPNCSARHAMQSPGTQCSHCIRQQCPNYQTECFPTTFYTVCDTRGTTTPHFSQRLQLYMALLVSVTQRLALTDLLSRPQKLTAIHDVSGAWSGLGAATATLWQQTNVAASTRATLLVVLYLSCISILHGASPTIMEFQAYNATSTTSVPSNITSPEPPVDVTTVAPLVPVMSSLVTGQSKYPDGD